jgi:hypothetical protein
MAILTSTALLPEFIKMRWNEPYVSAGLNRKTFKSSIRGVYSGFVVKPGPGSLEITIAHDDPEGYGLVSGFAGGNYDTASGWSVAVHESIQGFNTTIAILSSSQSNYSFDLSSYAGQTVYSALFVDYKSGLDSVASIKILEASDLEADPTLINLARIDVPLLGSISEANIIYDDPSYPRILPFANRFKYGLMDKFQAGLLEDLASVSSSPAFVYEYEVTIDGSPQTIDLPPLSTYVVGSDDLWVFKNGDYKTVGRDYLEIDRGDGYGEQIQYIGSLFETDVIKLRIQEYAASLTAKTAVLDEGALISDNVTQVNFSGSGVSVIPDGPTRVKVVIPGGGASSGVRTKKNESGVTIQAFRAVSLTDMNTIKYFDAGVSGENLYGITIQNIPDGLIGDVRVFGVVEGALTGVSGLVPGQTVYASQVVDGVLTPDVPDPFLGQVVIVGIAEGPQDLVSGVPTDILIEKGRLA